MHAALNGQVRCLSCIFSMGQYTHILSISLQMDNTVASSNSKNGVGIQTISGLSTVADNTCIDQLINREFGVMPLAMTKQIYGSNNNVHIGCQYKALYLNKLHGIVKRYCCPNYKGAQIPVLSGLNIKA